MSGNVQFESQEDWLIADCLSKSHYQVILSRFCAHKSLEKLFLHRTFKKSMQLQKKIGFYQQRPSFFLNKNIFNYTVSKKMLWV